MTNYSDISPTARFELESLFQNRENFSNAQFSEILAETCDGFGLSTEVAEAYYQRVSALWEIGPYETISIFVRDADWLAGKPCTDVRYGTQMLPRGVWVVGFINPTLGGEARAAMLSVPHLKGGEQLDDFRQVVVKALLLAGDMNAEENAELLMDEEFILLRQYKGIRREDLGR